MPVGNGEVVANVWVDGMHNGSLALLIGRSDVRGPTVFSILALRLLCPPTQACRLRMSTRVSARQICSLSSAACALFCIGQHQHNVQVARSMPLLVCIMRRLRTICLLIMFAFEHHSTLFCAQWRHAACVSHIPLPRS